MNLRAPFDFSDLRPDEPTSWIDQQTGCRLTVTSVDNAHRSVTVVSSFGTLHMPIDAFEHMMHLRQNLAHRNG